MTVIEPTEEFDSPYVFGTDINLLLVDRLIMVMQQ